MLRQTFWYFFLRVWLYKSSVAKGTELYIYVQSKLHNYSCSSSKVILLVVLLRQEVFFIGNHFYHWTFWWKNFIRNWWICQIFKTYSQESFWRNINSNFEIFLIFEKFSGFMLLDRLLLVPREQLASRSKFGSSSAVPRAGRSDGATAETAFKTASEKRVVIAHTDDSHLKEVCFFEEQRRICCWQLSESQFCKYCLRSVLSCSPQIRYSSLSLR